MGVEPTTFRLGGGRSTIEPSGLDRVRFPSPRRPSRAEGRLLHQPPPLPGLGPASGKGRLPDAVFAANDQMALGLIHALNDGGIQVPRNISVVGFDDIDGAAYFDPPLTTIRQDFQALGESCINVLVEAIASADTKDPKPITPKLIIRASAVRAAG